MMKLKELNNNLIAIKYCKNTAILIPMHCPLTWPAVVNMGYVEKGRNTRFVAVKQNKQIKQIKHNLLLK